MRSVLFMLVVAVIALAMAIPLSVAPAVAADPRPDYAVPGGWFFSQAAPPGETGYTILDDGNAKMWSEFNRLGGVNAVGYPVSHRFQWSGFLCQTMQRVVFQWRPDIGQVYFANVFDLMSETGKDDWLLSTRQTPKPFVFNEAGKTWDQIVSLRLAALNANAAIKAAYNSVVGDPVTMNGLPTSHVSDMGDNFTIRAQRVVIQQWKVAKPWAAANQVTFGLGGAIAKEAGLLPLGSAPGPAPTTAPVPTTPPPVVESGDMSMTDIKLDASNHIIFTFNRTGFGNSPVAIVKYQVSRYNTGLGGYVKVQEATAAAIPGVNNVITSYTFALTAGYDNKVKVVLDPEHVLADTNLGNNEMLEFCNATTHRCDTE
jgi:hypothetical protein